MDRTGAVEDVLAHFGIKGMKWGKRKLPVSREAGFKAGIKNQVRREKIASVSNQDLQRAIDRMQLEQNFKRLAVNEKSGITRWLSSTMLEIGKREVQAAAAKKVAGLVARKLATGGAA